MLISPSPDLLPDVVGRNRKCRWKEGSVHVPNCKSILVTEGERKHVRRRTRFLQHTDANFHQDFFPFQGKVPKEIHAILAETLWEYAPSYTTVTNWVVQFKRRDFSTCDAPRPGRPTTVTTPELNLEYRRISVKSIAEQLGISRERVGSIIHEDLDKRKLSTKWVPKCLNADQKRQRCQLSEQLLDFFFGAIQMISCRDW